MDRQGKNKNNLRIFIAGAILVSMLALTVSAAGSITVMQTHTGESAIVIYVKGTGQDVSDASVQIGITPCTSVESGSLSELKYPVKTLLLLDNSLSIPEKTRGTIAEIFQNVISDREAYEQIAIAVFDEDIRYLTDYTSDYTTLKSAVGQITYQDLETHLTDVLYELLSSEYAERTEDAYWRIVVVSDGMDIQSVRATKEELHNLLGGNAVPIYTIGMQTGKNESQLADLFALSRMSRADSFLLDGLENCLDVNIALNADREIVRYTIIPPGELMDGSRKSVKFTFAYGNSLSVEVVMPQQELSADADIKEISTDQETPSIHETESVTEPAVPAKPVTSGNQYGLLAVLGVVVAGIILVTVVIMSAKHRKKKADNQKADSNTEKTDEDRDKDQEEQEGRRTTVWKNQEKRGNTRILFGSPQSYDILLTDIESPVRTFQYPLKDMMTLGADRTCDIQITDDEYMSGQHCRITVKGERFYLEDLQSKNGTFLNDSRITAETEIVSGNVILLGDTRLRFEVQYGNKTNRTII